jgi:UDP-N-acetylmuramyl pentapeptide phosphotransferase/UDP-N-acetylglucosamine-1-phosphate transferase
VGFPKAVDYHKQKKPKVPTGLGVFYVLLSSVYLFTLSTYFYRYDLILSTRALTLSGCILFGGFMGLFDDWADLKWRYKAVIPVLASLPLIALREGTPTMSTFIFNDFFRWLGFKVVGGEVNFGKLYFILIIPLIITVTTNTVNQLGGLNGLETICPLIVMVGLAVVSFRYGLTILLYVPIIACLILAVFNYSGKIFVGNTGTFALGITLASFAILANVELTLLIAILPYIFNSLIILLNRFLFHKKAEITVQGDKLVSRNIRSLQTLVARNGPLSERRIVQIIALIFLVFTALAILVWKTW